MLTLKKVKELVGAPSHAKRTPSPKMLYEEGIVLLRREFDQGSHLTVYNSGYVLFSAGKRNTVFHIHDCCGDYAYDAAEGKGDVIEEEYFENCEWHIRALFEGERKMEDNQAKCEGAGRSNVCVSYHALSEDWSEIADRTINMLEKIIENEAVHIKSGKINCIIVKDLSRLGRNYIEMGKYLEQIFPMMGIRFIAINDNYDNANTESSDSDSIVVPFKNLLNDSYCRDISIKVRSQLDMKRRKGEFIGGYAIYGYCKDKRNKNRLVVDEYAADIVRSIYRRKLEGMSAQAIAEQLNSENVLAPSEYKRLCGLNYHSGFKAGTHAKWQAIQVLRILKNEVYTGTMVQGRRQKINYKIKKIRNVEESGWIRVPNMHEAIIPQKLFDTVQEVLKLDTCASKGQQAVNLFSGIVRCGGCGQNMVRRTVSKNGKKYIYLHCVTNHNGLGCSSHLISESKLAEVVLAALQGKIQQISGLEHRLDEINEIPKNERRLKSVEEHLKMLEQEEQKYQTLRRQLYEDMSSGIVSKEEYKEFSHSFNEKVEAIRKAKAEMNRQRDCLNNLDVEHLPWIEDFKSYQNLTSLNRRVLVELVESITVYDKEHIHIQYRFDQEIRNVLEYCSSVPAAETEESAV